MPVHVETLLLTDVVVFPAWPKLKAQREWGEKLELLWELERWVWLVALPALKALSKVLADTVAIVIHHIQHIALGTMLQHRRSVVRTEHIQVIVDANVDVIVTPLEPAGKNKRRVTACHRDQYVTVSRTKESRAAIEDLTNQHLSLNWKCGSQTWVSPWLEFVVELQMWLTSLFIHVRTFLQENSMFVRKVKVTCIKPCINHDTHRSEICKLRYSST